MLARTARGARPRGARGARFWAVFGAILGCLGHPVAVAQAPRVDRHLEPPPPPEHEPPFFGYYAHLDFAAPVATQPLCPDGGGDCVLSGGAGIELGFERRFASGISLGAAYGVTFHDAGGVYEISVLQWFGPRLRYGWLPDRVAHPYFAGGLALVMFGETLAVATVGGGVELEVGVDLELDAAVRLRFSMPWRLFALSAFTTPNDDVLRADGFGINAVVSLRVGVVLLDVP